MDTVYHISSKYLGKRPILVPRIPLSAPEHEAPIPRICVARQVSDCYLSCQSEFNYFGAPTFHVYKAKVERTRKAHKSVEDREWTGERWLLDDTRFEHVGKMPKIRFMDLRSWHSNAWRTRIVRDWVEGTFQELILRAMEGGGK